MVEGCRSETTIARRENGKGHVCSCARAGQCRNATIAGSDLPTAPLDLAALAAAPLQREPFDHVVIPNFVPKDACAAARACFPLSDHGGLAPAPSPEATDPLGKLLNALRQPEVTATFARKFEVPLDPNALMIHLRSRCQAKDGRVHTDSTSKLVTALLYLNETWPHQGGRLRLLRSRGDLGQGVAEVPPLDGMLVAFRRTDHSWHGHLPFEGIRRCIMFNWMVDADTARRETRRHAVSAVVKRLFSNSSVSL